MLMQHFSVADGSSLVMMMDGLESMGKRSLRKKLKS